MTRPDPATRGYDLREKPHPFGWHCCRGAHLVNTPCAVLPRWWNVVAEIRWARQSYPL